MQRIITLLSSYITQLHMPAVRWTDVAEIIIITYLIYHFLVWLRDTRAWSLLRGFLVILIFAALASLFNMTTILWIIQNVTGTAIIALVVILQPELRTAMEDLGRKMFPFAMSRTPEGRFSDKTISELVRACLEMSRTRTGALIVIEQTTPLKEYERTGIAIDGAVTSQLLINIFEKNTPLHDGAVIVEGDRVVSATCYLPLSTNHLDKNLGTRHRAAVGVSETTDALTLVVSEETGGISVAYRGVLTQQMDAESLRARLVRIQNKGEDVGKKKGFLPWAGDRIENRRINLLENPGLKIFSLAFAFILWFMVTNFSDPVSYFYATNVKVALQNTDVLTTQGETYTVLQNSDTISTVTVAASRSVIDSFQNDDVIATADLANMRSDGTVPIVLTTNKNRSQVKSITASNNEVRLRVEKKVTKSVPLEAKTTGELVAGYYLSEVSAGQNQLRISGPASVVEQVKSAEASVDIGGYTERIRTTSPIVLLDESGSSVSQSGLEMSVNTVTLTAEILPTQKVSIKVSASGTPADGYRAGTVSVSPSSVTVAARASVLEDLSAITISSSEVSISGADSTVKVTVDLSRYLPDGVELADSDFDGTVTVTVPVTKEE